MTPGVVLVHGFGGTPATVAPVARRLEAHGLAVRAPALDPAGPWDAWEAAVRVAAAELAEASAGGRVVLAGQSLGAAVVLSVALDAPHVAAVVLINPLAVPADEDTLEFLEGRLERGRTEVANEPATFADPEASEPDAPATVPVAGILASHRGVAALFARMDEGARPACPVLVLRAEHDDVLGPEHAARMAALLGDAVTVRPLPRGGHVATLDFDRDLVADDIAALARTPAR